jgi:glyoxylase I family protein
MRIHHIALRTRDVRRLRAFYEDGLGLAVTRENSEGSVWLDAGGTILMLEPSEEAEPGIAPRSRELIAFAVVPKDREDLEARLASHGIAIEARTDFTLYFRDPDGRRIGLSHYPERA